MRSRCAVLVVGVLIAHGALTGATLAQAEAVTQPLPRFAIAPFPAHAVFAVVSSSSSVDLSLFTGGTRSMLLGSVRLFLGDPEVPVIAQAGVVGISVDTCDLIAPDFEPELPGMLEPLHLVENQAVRSIGAWNTLTGEIGFELYLIAPAGNLPVQMPLRLQGKLDASGLAVTGDNGDVPDGSMTVAITAVKLRTAPPQMPPPVAVAD